MRDWSYSINSHPKWMSGTVRVVEQPWWLSLVEWCAERFPPRFLFRVRLPGRRRSVGSLLFHSLSHALLQWAWHHPMRREWRIELGYEEVHRLFNDKNPEFFNEEAGLRARK